METTSSIDDAEFSLPPEFLTDDDFLVEKEKDDRFSNCLFPYESSHGFELDSGFDSALKPIDGEGKLLAGLIRKMAQSSLEDDLSGGLFAFPARNNDTKAWGSTRCVAGGRQNQNCQTTVAWDLHCSGAAEELAVMSINGYNNLNGRGILDLPRKHPLAAAKISNDGSGYYNRHSLQYQKLQAIHFQQQELMKRHRQLVQQSRGLGANHTNKIAASVDFLSPSAWSNQHVFLGNNHGSTGTGVFLPRCVNHATAEVHEKPNGSWSNDGGFSSQMKMEQAVKEPRLPLDWAY